jgi:hypothetical protein
VSGDDERPRERRSWREIDQLRDRARSPSERRPRDRAAEQRVAAASKQYVKQLDAMFSGGKGGADGAHLARAVRDAHGTPGLADACRAYRDAVGAPEDPALISLFLDCADAGLVLAALESLRALRDAGGFEPSRGLLSQLRILAQDPADAVADAAEALLEDL